MAKVISFLNFKGGVGKSTSTVNVAKALFNLGYKTLVVDADAQGNASKMMGYRSAKAEEEPLKTLYDAMTGKVDLKYCICLEKEDVEGYEFVPANSELYFCEQELVSKTGREYILKMLLEPHLADYDYILIDCPPNNGLLAINAMCASDYLIIPINCEVFALDGMGMISAKYEEVKKIINPKLEILGYLMARYDKRLTLHRDAVKAMETTFGDKVFKTKIRTNIPLAQSPAQFTNVFEIAPDSPGAKDYLQLAKEILSRITNH